MKKTIVALAAIMLLISCGGSSEKPASADSVVISADSVAVADSSIGSGPVFQAKDGELGNPTKRKSDTDVHGVEIIK